MSLPHPRRAPRRTRAGLVGATVVCATVCAVVLAGCGSGDDGAADGADDGAAPTPSTASPSETPDEPATGPGSEGVTRLTAGPGGATGRCLPPTADNLAGADVAVDATATAVSRRQVELAPTRWYAGEPTETVVVRAVPEVLSQLLQAVEFREGERYLVAAGDDGTVMVCGFSDAWSPRLERTYAAAFGGS